MSRHYPSAFYALQQLSNCLWLLSKQVEEALAETTARGVDVALVGENDNEISNQNKDIVQVY